MNPIWQKIRRKIIKSCLRPIRVFCFHQVSPFFDESYMHRGDWLQTDVFKQLISDLKKQGYEFISLPQAHKHLKYDLFRRKKYAVLTADDGWASLQNILPWLNEQQIPVTLFLNPSYLDGKHFREKTTEQYLTSDEVAHLYEQYPLLTIGSHGWEHVDATTQTVEDFSSGLAHSVAYLERRPNYVPFFAFTYGRHSQILLDVVQHVGLTPILVNGGLNYKMCNGSIDREVLELEAISRNCGAGWDNLARRLIKFASKEK